MASNSVNIHRLQRALNSRGYNILYSTSQFYSKDQNRPITQYIIKQATYDAEKDKMVNTELFKSFSQIQILLYLRDLWYSVNGQEIPKDNPTWNKIKESQKVDIENMRLT